jgi:aryl sulfotransferase
MHGCNFTDLNNTLGVIYIVRDPRNVVNSLAHHNDLSVDEAADTMIDNSKFLVKSD